MQHELQELLEQLANQLELGQEQQEWDALDNLTSILDAQRSGEIGERLDRVCVTDAVTTPVFNTTAHFFKKTSKIIGSKATIIDPVDSEESNRGVHPYGKANGLLSLCRKSSQSLDFVQELLRNKLEAEKVHNEKVQQEKLKEVKARLNFKGCSGRNSKIQDTSQYFESRTPNKKGDLRGRLKPKRLRITSKSPERTIVFSRIQRDRSVSPRRMKEDKRRREGDVFHRLGVEGKVYLHTQKAATMILSSIEEEDLSQPWTCEEADPFTPRIRYFELPKKSRMPNNVKTYDGSDDPEDHLQIFQAVAKVERWAMPTWCHIFNSTLTGSARVWFDDLPPESIDSYDDLKKAFLANYLQPKKCINDPVKIHHIKQREGKSTKDFLKSFEAEISRQDDEDDNSIPSRRGSSLQSARKKAHSIWKQLEVGRKHNFDRRGDFKNQQKSKRRRDKFTLLTKSPKEILALDKGKFKTPSPMTTPVEKRNNNKFYQSKAAKKGETSGKDKAMAILMIQPEDGMKGPMIIEVELGGHFINTTSTTPLIGFSGEVIRPMGRILLLVKIGDAEHSTPAWMDFVVVRSPSPYNGIIGRPGVRKNQAVPSTAHGMLKFPFPRGVLTLWSSRIIPLECAMVSVPEAQPPDDIQAMEEKIKVAIHPKYPVQTLAIGSTLTEEEQKALSKHRLNVREGCSPVRQNKRGPAPERNKAIQEKVEKLVDASIMKEVHYHSWLLNPVIVKKHDDSWRTYVDFKDLNTACLKDDAYKGYHQIKIAKEDEEKTTFITNQWIFRYSKMPFSLKNTGATYQRLVDKALQKQIGGNLEVYVDDLRKACSWVTNPKKCAFRIEEGMFLDKVEAVLSLQSPKCLKDVQKLNGKLASMNRFLPKSAEKSLPFFKTLKTCTKKNDFQWTAEAEAAFKQMKQLIAELPTLTAPVEKEKLIVYLAVAQEAVSAVLMTERKAKQMPVYFVSRALQGPKVNYTSMEKLYRPRTSVKRKILADFIVERPEDDCLDTPMEVNEELPDPWTLFTDESSCVDGSRAGLILTDSKGVEFTYALRFKFEATNNKAEYKALIAGFKIAEQMGIKNLQDCQVHYPMPRNPQQKLTSIMSSWPFYKWGIDIARPFPEGPGKVKFLIVAMDYFMKWIEAKTVATITDNPFKDWCEKLCIRQRFASVKHPQANGLVERANKSLGEGIKVWLDKRSKDWIEEVPHVLWAHRTMIKSINEDTPFSLTYETEAVIPAEIAIREARSKAKMEKYYNFKVRNISFRTGDLVYWNNDASHAKDSGKLNLKWEGPYEVTEALGNGAYKLRELNGKHLSRTWNIRNLKKCYVDAM
uniref:Reverse transcriptase domain-containing protein n=1 Tax=Tanacetum cinerariifolium TaxID=118510 RepID=A0A6L2J015_TANCI|nr:hypothetical protein [Tanacetum cinerariifolium]